MIILTNLTTLPKYPIMNIDTIRDFCLSFPGTSESLPFDESTLVFKVMGKIFAITDIDDFESISLKCSPEIAQELRERYQCVSPGYHLNKKHWNSIKIDGELSENDIKYWIAYSYQLVVQGLPKKYQDMLLLDTDDQIKRASA